MLHIAASVLKQRLRHEQDRKKVDPVPPAAAPETLFPVEPSDPAESLEAGADTDDPHRK